MFVNSAFTITLCGGKWESLASENRLTSNGGRFGCCSPGTFMAQPNLDPFSQATSCAVCPVGKTIALDNDDIECGLVTVPVLDCSYWDYADRSCGIRQAVDTYGDSATIAKYGVIQEWNVSVMTDMSYAFYEKSTFNEDISKWNVGAVTDMNWSTYTSPFAKKSILMSIALQLGILCYFFLTNIYFSGLVRYHNSYTYIEIWYFCSRCI